MKRTVSGFILLLLAVVLPQAAHSQEMPFVFTLYGGLYFPANQQFSGQYRSRSDLLWGGGIALPMEGLLYATFDESFFSATAFLDPSIDSSISLSEKFLHAGILMKQPLSGAVLFRIMGGMNYVTVKQSYTSPRSPEKSLEAEKKIGFYLGAGLEEMFPDGRASLFGDFVYDYRRSHLKQMEGDWGGVRAVVGVHLFLF
jgi:hypothetical protein